MRVFQIGFNKCGTSSIYARLDALGFSATHIKTRDGQYIASIMQQNLQEERHILTGLDDYDAFTDIEDVRADRFIEGYKLFPEIQAQVPDAWFILNIRDKEKWIASRLDHNDGRYAEALLALSGFSLLEELANSWRADWDDHIAKVKRIIPKERLLVYDIEKDDAAVIDNFLGRELVKPVSKAHQGFTHSAASKTLSKYIPKSAKKLFPAEFKRYILFLLRRRR